MKKKGRKTEKTDKKKNDQIVWEHQWPHIFKKHDDHQ